jgi:hypothetical protein
LEWINAYNIGDFYEPYALLRDEKSAILPKLANDVNGILFALQIDVAELNISTSKAPLPKDEPIINDVPSTSSKVIKSKSNVRKIDNFEETTKQIDALKISNDIKNITTALPVVQKEVLESVVQIQQQQQQQQQLLAQVASDRISISSSVSKSSSLNFYDVKNDTSDTISHSSMSSIEDEIEETKNAATVMSSTDGEKLTNTSNQDVENEKLIQKQRDRINELEQQVLDLTQENSRLRNLLNANKVNTLANFQISIPRFVLQKSKTKNFYVYEVNIRTTNGSESWTIMKRYRDFYKLNKQLKKEHLQIKCLDFPPKKKLGNMDFDFVEARRQRLQIYIKNVLQNLPELACCESKKTLEAKCPFFKSQ